MKSEKAFDVHDCEWKNESACEEEIEDTGLDFEEEETE